MLAPEWRPELATESNGAVWPTLGQAVWALRRGRDFAEVLENWLPLTYALNAVNRSMGRDDLYPFTLAEPVIDKLQFVHGRVQDASVVLVA